MFSQILTFNQILPFLCCIFVVVVVFVVVVFFCRFNIFICYKVLFSFLCHISIIYSCYVHHIYIYSETLVLFVICCETFCLYTTKNLTKNKWNQNDKMKRNKFLRINVEYRILDCYYKAQARPNAVNILARTFRKLTNIFIEQNGSNLISNIKFINWNNAHFCVSALEPCFPHSRYYREQENPSIFVDYLASNWSCFRNRVSQSIFVVEL